MQRILRYLPWLALTYALGCGDKPDTTPGTEHVGGAATTTSTGGTTNTGGAGGGGGSMNEADVDILRDERGIAHIYGGSQQSAFYGLGYATAQDRLYQMDEHRRFMHGRLSETFAGATSPAVDAKLLKHDTRMRVLGFARHAEAVLEHPDFPAEIRELIDAYTAGVNAFAQSDDFELPPGFAQAGVAAFEPWTSADSLLAWERIRERFNGYDMHKEVEKLLECESAGGCDVPACVPPIDDDAAVVPETSPWPPGSGSACHQPHREFFKPIEFKASHGWAVHGSRSTTGKPILAMDPKVALSAPSLFYGYHISWPGSDAAGIGIAGAPGYLIFWNRHVGQTLTAGGGDIADLFELELASNATGYVVDGQTQPFTMTTETIAVKGGDSVTLSLKESQFGPVVTDLLNAPAGREFALRHIDLMHGDTHSLVGVIEVMSATDLDSYRTAFDKWLTPGANAVFVTDEEPEGHIGYMLAGAIGRRVPNVVQGVDYGGKHPYDGSTAANDWQGYLSVNERPHVVDPEQGYVFSANHLPVGTWFNDYAYTGAIRVGDTHRSLRLRYMFAELLPTPSDKLSPAQVHDMHFDTKQDGVRLWRVMLQYLENRGAVAVPSGDTVAQSNAEKAGKLLLALDLFTTAGAELRYSNPQFPAARLVVGKLPFQMRAYLNPAIACKYNAAEGGFSYLVKSFDADPDGTMSDTDVSSFVVVESANLWDLLMGQGLSQDPNAWTAPGPTPEYLVEYQANQYCPTALASNCALDDTHSFGVPLDSAFGASIHSIHGSSGTGTIDFAAVDSAVHLVPMGASEDPASPHFKSGLAEWQLADDAAPNAIPDAPLSRQLVEPGAVSTVTLTYLP